MAKKQTKKTAAKTKETASSPHPKEWQEQIRELQEQRKRDYRILDKIWGIIFLAVGIFLVITTQLNTTGTFGNAIHSWLSACSFEKCSTSMEGRRFSPS